MSHADPASLYPRVSTLINTILNLEKGRIFKVDGRTVYPSEVHLLLEVAGSPAATGADLAASLGVTKGAVSQTITRLEAKGLVIKNRDPGNRNALRLDLTDQGRRTVDFFRRKTAVMRDGVAEHLERRTPAEKRAIAAFLDCLTRELEDLGRV